MLRSILVLNLYWKKKTQQNTENKDYSCLFSNKAYVIYFDL